MNWFFVVDKYAVISGILVLMSKAEMCQFQQFLCTLFDDHMKLYLCFPIGSLLSTG